MEFVVSNGFFEISEFVMGSAKISIDTCFPSPVPQLFDKVYIEFVVGNGLVKISEIAMGVAGTSMHAFLSIPVSHF